MIYDCGLSDGKNVEEYILESGFREEVIFEGVEIVKDPGKIPFIHRINNYF